MPRGWKRTHFLDHPGYECGDPDAFVGGGNTRDKIKVWCIECHHRRVEGLVDPDALQNLWSDPTAGWIPSRSDALSLHLRRCVYQPQDVRDRARAEHETSLQQRRKRRNSLRCIADRRTVDVLPVPVNNEPHTDLGSNIAAVTSNMQGLAIMNTVHERTFTLEHPVSTGPSTEAAFGGDIYDLPGIISNDFPLTGDYVSQMPLLPLSFATGGASHEYHHDYYAASYGLQGLYTGQSDVGPDFLSSASTPMSTGVETSLHADTTVQPSSEPWPYYWNDQYWLHPSL